MAKKENYKTLELPNNYKPKKSEPYMCPMHLAYFYNILKNQYDEIISNRNSVLNAVRMAEKTESLGVGDESDNATFNQDISMDLRISDRNSKVLQKIEAAFERLETGTYGYSIVSGDEIGIQRMIARPLATMTTEEQEEYEARRG